MNKKRLSELARKIHEIATSHGWHEEKKSDAHWLCMVMTEIAEAVEADRKGKRANMKDFQRLIKFGEVPAAYWKVCYSDFIKGSLEEEFADIVIRILDFANEKFGDSMEWQEWNVRKVSSKTTFTEKAFSLLRWMTNENIGMSEITLFVQYMYSWSESLEIDLDWHIDAKMRYNDMRGYRHGNKAY